MNRMTLQVVLAVALGIGYPAFAADQPAAGRQGDIHELRVSSMGTMTVTSSQLQALQSIKQALHRDYSMNAADADKLVCKVSTVSGSRLHKQLTCETNRQWWRREEVQAVQLNIALMSAGTGGTVAALQSLKGRNVAFSVPIKYARFRKLMSALPPAAASQDAKDNSERQGSSE